MSRFIIGTAVLCAVAAAQSGRVAYIEVEVANSTVYRFDVSDPTRHATSSAPVPPLSGQPFTDFCQVDDVVAVNGKPAEFDITRTPGRGTVARYALQGAICHNPQR
jgi:hypothetical protein